MKMVNLVRTLVVFFLFCSKNLWAQTCDLDFISYNPINHEVEIAILDGTNCGCNEFNLIDGNTCEESSSTIVQNNNSVTHLVFGLHYNSFEYSTECTVSTQFHPDWSFVVGSDIGDEWFTGDTANFILEPPFGWECILDTPVDGLCWEIVIWQINLSQTAEINDFPTEYWTDTCGVCANQTQMYPDIDLSNNSLIFCPDDVFEVYGCMYEDATNYDDLATIDDGSCEYEECPIYGCTSPTACNYDQYATFNYGCVFCDTPGGEEICNEYHNIEDYWDWYVNLFDCEETDEVCDTIIEYLYDTLIVTVPEIIYDTLTIIDVVDSLVFITDTIYVELPPDTITIIETELVTDTLYVNNYIYEYDTIYITGVDTLYITLLDTITEYVIQELLIDCNTGLPCGEEPPGFNDDCGELSSIFIPNSFTPNNDGLNDVWEITYDLWCWEDLEFWIYNRWGQLVYYGEGEPFWNGSVNGGNYYVADGIYVYKVKARKINRVDTFIETGHIHMFR